MREELLLILRQSVLIVVGPKIFGNKIGIGWFKLMTKRFVLSFYIGARDPVPLPEVRVSLFCGHFLLAR